MSGVSFFGFWLLIICCEGDWIVVLYCVRFSFSGKGLCDWGKEKMIWMGWQKKMLWFVLTTLLSILDGWVYFLRYGVPFEYTPFTALVDLAILVVPLFFLKDDEVRR